jgi:hypothetical protein
LVTIQCGLADRVEVNLTASTDHRHETWRGASGDVASHVLVKAVEPVLGESCGGHEVRKFQLGSVSIPRRSPVVRPV